MDNTDTSLLGRLLASDGESTAGAVICETPRAVLPGEMPYAMAYVPYQQWTKVYDSEAGLERGTVFPCLDKPFIGEEAVKNV
ncbi:MAG: spore coat associated protein CotJA [Ruminococcus sp.]|nr:spore coat associated protein CotJA [Ruminococcus sp.]